MGARVAHRGPDGAGDVLLEGNGRRERVGLAHRRLAIIDLSAEGAQPMGVHCAACGSDSLEGLALTYNGEIYNFPALRADLQARGHTFHSRTDSEVLLHLYAEQGLAMLCALNGMFAFALRDGRERGRPAGVERGDVLLARDPLGVKPLYYAQCSEGILFASELKALLAHEGLERELDLEAVHTHLAYLWTPAPATLLKGVRKLPPGCAMLLRCGAIVREWRYYDIPVGRPAATVPADELARQLAEQLHAAVDRQLISDVEVGAFLSGGLDSSALVALARPLQRDVRRVCYTISWEHDAARTEGMPDDLPFARRVGEHLGAEVRVIQAHAGLIDGLEEMLYTLDEPQADPAPLNVLAIAQRARADGIPVLLSGAGGDDLFGGYRRHRALLLERYWRGLPAFLRSGLAHGARALGTRSVAGISPAVRRLAKAFAGAELSEERRLVSYFWWGDSLLRRGLYSADMAASVSGLDEGGPLLESLARIPSANDRLERMLYLELKHFLADHNLNYTDKAAMAAGVEVRVPYLDLELVDFAATVPARLKVRGRTGKYLLKRAMEPYLPREVIYRGKTGFGMPIRRWLRQELRDYVRETLGETALRRRGLFDPDAVARLLRLDAEGRIDGTYTIFALMCIELWCRRFLDRGFAAQERATRMGIPA